MVGEGTEADMGKKQTKKATSLQEMARAEGRKWVGEGAGCGYIVD